VIAVLVAAIALLGATPVQLGAPDPSFWCMDLVNVALADAGQTGGGTSPGAVMRSLMPLSVPSPGAIVAVDLFPGNGVAEHVAVVESVNGDGSLNTIEGNGPDRDRVVRSTRPVAQVLGYGATVEAGRAYRAGLCADLQLAKPWTDWDCGAY